MNRIFHFILLILMFCFIFSNCKNNDDTSEETFLSEGSILGQDFTLCPCCGGYLIEIDDTVDRWNFYDLPDNSDIDLDSAVFPINVRLDWDTNNEACPNIITITKIEER